MDTEPIASLLFLILVLGLGWLALRGLLSLRHVYVVFDYQEGLLYHQGKLLRSVGAGRHVFWGREYFLWSADRRTTSEPVPNQEVLTSEGLSVRISAVMDYAVEDALRAFTTHQDYRSGAYAIVHSALRNEVSNLTAEEIPQQREGLALRLTERCAPLFEELGLRLARVQIRDLTFPPELKRVYSLLASAQKEGQAALERARGETAALRSLANAAKMLENNPALLQLRTLQALNQAPGSTIVLNTGDPLIPLRSTADGTERPEQDGID
jgi:regulator of protease activity HflC (stomatin/prohibitin superfamily)